MKQLRLNRNGAGELRVWVPPDPEGDYIIGCDPSLGRNSSEATDHSCVVVMRRTGFRSLELCAEFYGRWLAARVGELMACIGRWYVNADDQPALVNIERNIADASLYAMRREKYVEERFYLPNRFKSPDVKLQHELFFQKTVYNQHFLLQELQDYLERDAIKIYSSDIISDLRSLEMDERGHARTRGRDRAVAIMMAVICDSDSDATTDFSVIASTPETKPCPPGVDPKGWRELHNIPHPKKPGKELPKAGSWGKQRPF